MKKNKRKFNSRLSFKIVLTQFLIVILFSSLAVLFIKLMSHFSNGSAISEDKRTIWLTLFPLIYGTIVVLTITYIFNQLIISRIKKLENATARIAKGDFSHKIEVRGHDELSDLARSFNTMLGELEANEYLSKDFIRNISHEYKTPLAVIRAYSELIEWEVGNKKPNKENINDYLKIINDETERMSSLSKNIIQISLLDSTTIIKKDDFFSPSEQIKNCLNSLHLLWVDKNIEVDFNLSDVKISNNQELVYQIWQNLINNAIKFANPGSILSINLKDTDKEIIFDVSNQGPMIKEEEREAIFNDFFMSERSRNNNGSGLGLTIVKKIVDKLGGSVELVESNLEVTTFRVVLNK